MTVLGLFFSSEKKIFGWIRESYKFL